MKNVKSKMVQAAIFFAVTLISVSCMNDKRQDNKMTTDNKNEQKFVGVKSNKNDAQFLFDVAEINRKEITLGQLAQKRGIVKHVKDLGEMMETDHNKSLTELKVLANSKNITLPTSLTEKGQDDYNTLNEKSDSEFGKTYSDMTVKRHKETISLFEKAAKESSDPEIRAWAKDKLPGLRTHLEHSLSCQKECAKI